MKKILVLLSLTLLVQFGYSQQWNMTNMFCPPDIHDLECFGSVCFQNDDYLVVRSSSSYSDGSVDIDYAGAIHVYRKSVTGFWECTQKIFARPGFRRQYSSFGFCVCIHGDYMFVSDPESSYGGVFNCGIVFIYKLDENGIFFDDGFLLSNDQSADELFGMSLGASGKFLFIGGPGDQFDASGLDEKKYAGSVDLFTLDDSGNWNFTKKLVAPERGIGHYFGRDISVYGNGLAVCEPYYETPDDDGDVRGKVHYYEYSSMLLKGWNYESSIVDPDGEIASHFCSAIDLKGSTMVISDEQYSLNSNGLLPLDRAGLVYVYIKQPKKNKWVLQTKLTAYNREEGGYFGTNLSIDGDFIAVGAPNDGTGQFGADMKNNAGAVYLFSKKSGQWSYMQKLLSPNREIDRFYGKTVSLNAGSIAVGDQKSLIYGQGRGAVVCYEYQPATGKFELETSCAINIYPNPAEDWLTVDMGDIDNIKELSLMTLSGAEVLHRSVSTQQYKLDLSNLDAGVYILTVSTSEGLFNERVIVR